MDSLEEIEAVHRAIVNGDAAEAERTAVDHVQKAAEVMVTAHQLMSE
jgi:hypothetical protein